jgi:uncharacterized protein
LSSTLSECSALGEGKKIAYELGFASRFAVATRQSIIEKCSKIGRWRGDCLMRCFGAHTTAARRFSFDSSRCLNCHSNIPLIIANTARRTRRQKAEWGLGEKQGNSPMARFEILDSNTAPLGEGPAAGDVLFELGMMYSVGRDVPVDLVSAHKWFNLAAVKGNREAIRLRQEVADQMSDGEVATAQRAARDWLKTGHTLQAMAA